MTAKVRRTRLLARGVQPISRRDPNIFLSVVATEDTHAAKQYLEGLQAGGLVDQSRVHIVTLPTADGRSSLRALLDRLEEYRSSIDVAISQDEYWAVFDVDHHKPKELTQGAQIAKTRGQHLAGSNPCFELWLLLHLTDNIEAIASGSNNRHAARRCEDRLHQALQGGESTARGYDKANIGAERFATADRVRDACARAKSIAAGSKGPWPSKVGTHMHLLIERLPT